jgi:TolB-like protein/DNA-binding winged helix-turn-helix (wHTH) protein
VPAPAAILVDDWSFQPETGELVKRGAPVHLQDLPAQVLDALLSRPGELVTREELIARLWPRGAIDVETGLNSAVRKLRSALDDDADAPRYVETVPRKGYRFIGRITTPESTPVPPPTLVPPVAPPSSTRRTGLRVGIATAVAIIGAAIAWLAFAPDSPPDAARAASHPLDAVGRLRLAILPFENLSADDANELLADGLHEELLATLTSRAPNLDVISRTTMRLYRATPKPAREIARELDVSHVLAGSVRREGRTVRLTLQLIDGHRDTQLWSRSFDRELGDAMHLQSQVATEVASQLAVKLSGNIAELPPSDSQAAHDRYIEALRSMDATNAFRSRDRQLAAERLLDAAIALDPDFAAAYLERSRIRLAKFMSSQDTSEANRAALRADLAKVRNLTGEAPPLLISEAEYAQLIEMNPDQALRLLRRGEELNPNSSEVFHVVAQTLASMNDAPQALAYFERAARLDPGNALIVADWASCLRMDGRGAEAMRVTHDFDNRYPGRITYGWRLYAFTGSLERAEAEIARLDASDAAARLAVRFDILRLGGRLDELATLLDETSLDTIPNVTFAGFSLPAVGRKPVAEMRGWVHLLRHDPVAATRDGDSVLEFVASEPVTRWNAWHLRLLAAEGALFKGDRPRATAEARAALMLAPERVHVATSRYARAVAARVLAWSGATDDAAALLVTLATRFPRTGPADIARDPLYAVPLADNMSYKRLARDLEAEIAANQHLQ